MITKVIKSKDLRATLDYVYQDHKDPDLIHGSVFPASREGAYAEISEAISQRPQIKQPVFHGIISVPVQDSLDEETWQIIARDYVERMGFKDAPYVAIKHNDTEHEHIHIVASRVDLYGKLISDSHDWNRSEQIARDLEKRHDLTPVLSSWNVDERRARQQEYHQYGPDKERSPRETMRMAIASTLEDPTLRTDVKTFATHLEIHHGVTMKPRLNKEENQVIGVWFETQNKRIPGSKIHRQYSWNRLQSKLAYDPQKDFEGVRTLSRSPEDRAPSSPQKMPDSSPVHRPEPLHHGTSERAHRPSARPVKAAPKQTQHPALVLSQTQRKEVIRALKSAPEDKGWKAWSDSLRAQGVQPLPKVSQGNHDTLNGMYFVAHDVRTPASSVSREHSLHHLQTRLGSYIHERDKDAFPLVYVPTIGVQSRESLTPNLSKEPLPSKNASGRVPVYEDTLSPLVRDMRSRGVDIVVNPEQAEGYWRGDVINARGERCGVISSETASSISTSRRVDLVALNTPSPPSTLPLHTRVFWDRDTYTLRPSTPQKDTPERIEVQSHKPIQRPPEASRPTHAPLPHEDTLSPLVRRLQQDHYTIDTQTKSYKGYWRGEVTDNKGERYAVLSAHPPAKTPPDHKGACIIKLDSSATLHKGEYRQGRLHLTQKYESTASYKVGEPVMYREQNKRQLFAAVPDIQAPAKDASSPLTTPRTSPSAVDRSSQKPTLELYLKRAREQGRHVQALEPEHACSGKLLPQKLELQEGTYRAVETASKKLVLIPEHETLRDKDSTRVYVQAGETLSTLYVKSLDPARSKDRGPESP